MLRLSPIVRLFPYTTLFRSFMDKSVARVTLGKGFGLHKISRATGWEDVAWNPIKISFCSRQQIFIKCKNYTYKGCFDRIRTKYRIDFSLIGQYSIKKG